MPQTQFATLLLLGATCATACGGEADMLPNADGVAPSVVVTGRLLSRNGTTEVPPGLFGVHAMSPTDAQADDWGIESLRVIEREPSGVPLRAEGVKVRTDITGRSRQNGFPTRTKMLVECFYDRFQPALQLTNCAWQAHLVDLARRYGSRAAESDQAHYVEFWNEPYLNWATKPGVNYHGRYYETSNVAQGLPMRIRGQAADVPNLVWDAPRFVAYNPRTDEPDYVRTSYIPNWAKPGDPTHIERVRGAVRLDDGMELDIYGPCRLRYEWFGRDLTQKHYWSGEVNRGLYLEMAVPFIRALKETSPRVKVAVGWGINIFNENWDVWHLLYRPTIDACAQYADALHEHHYGGDTRKVVGSYEVAYAYGLTRHGRRFEFWNTEAGGYLDPEQPGVINSWHDGSELQRAWGAFNYFVRDVIHVIATCPDKGVARAVHHPQYNGGDEWAFKLLKPLRGRLLEIRSGVAGVWCVGAIEGERITLALFNDREEPVAVPLRVALPRKLAEAGATLRTVVELPDSTPDRPQLGIRETPLAAKPGARTLEWTCELAKKQVGVVVIPLKGDEKPIPVVAETQHVADDILVRIPPGGEHLFLLRVPDERIARCESAALRLVTDYWMPDVVCELNAVPLALDVYTEWTLDHPLPADLPLSGDNVFRVRNRSAREVMVATVSLLIRSAGM